jgi:hypothetical protein
MSGTVKQVVEVRRDWKDVSIRAAAHHPTLMLRVTGTRSGSNCVLGWSFLHNGLSSERSPRTEEALSRLLGRWHRPAATHEKPCAASFFLPSGTHIWTPDRLDEGNDLDE